jgi:hypothetical protein
VVNQLSDHKRLRLRSWFFRYSFAEIFLASRDWRGFSCGNLRMGRSDLPFVEIVASPRNWASRHRHLPADLSSIHRHEAPHGVRVFGSLPSLERVFAFFANPENLPRIMPASRYTQLIGLNRVPPPEVPAEVSRKKAAGVG